MRLRFTFDGTSENGSSGSDASDARNADSFLRIGKVVGITYNFRGCQSRFNVCTSSSGRGVGPIRRHNFDVVILKVFALAGFMWSCLEREEAISFVRRA